MKGKANQNPRAFPEEKEKRLERDERIKKHQVLGRRFSFASR